MKTQELLAKLVSGYAKNKPNLKCSIGIISQEKVERFQFGSDGMEIPILRMELAVLISAKYKFIEKANISDESADAFILSFYF